MNLIAAVCCVGLIGCDSKSPEELMAVAAQHAALNDNKAAIIELKNAISQAPNLAAARLAISDLYFASGEAAAAEKELIKARDLGASDNQVLPTLSKVLFYSDQYGATISLEANESLTDLDAISTHSLFQYLASLRGNTTELKVDIEEIKERLTDSDETIFEAYQSFVQRDFKTLDVLLEKISEGNDRPAVMSWLKANYNQTIGKHEEAASHFAKVNELVPIVNSVNFLHVNALINADDLEEAKKQIAVLSKVNPKHPVTNLFKANIAYREQNYEDALAFSDVAIQNGSDTVTARIIGAVSAYKLKSMEKSYRNLINLTERENFKNSDIERLLSLVQLNLGYTEQAASNLTSIGDLSPQDSYLLSSAGMDLAKQGNLGTARSLLDRAQQLDASNPDHKMRSAVIEIGNNESAVISNLQEVLAIDESSEEAWIQMALSYARSGNKSEAMKAAQQWGEKNKVGGLILEGRVYLELNQPSHAIQKLREAAKLEKGNENVNRFLLLAYEKAEDYSGLYNTAKNILSNSPNNTQASLGLVKAAVTLGRRLDADKIFNANIKRDPENEIPHVMLAINAKLNDDLQTAIDILERRKFTTNEMGLMTLGDSYAALKDYEKAEGVYELWTKQSPKSIIPLMRVIGIKSLLEDYEEALSLSEKAEAKFPHLRTFTVLKLVYQIELRNFTAAKTTLQLLQEEDVQQETLVSYQEGQIALYDKNYEKAEKLLGEYHKLMPSFQSAVLWARSLIALERKFEAKKVLESEYNRVESPTVFMRHTMAEFYSHNSYFTRAATQYEKLLEEQGESVLVLNNLAMVEQRAGRLKVAKSYAARAVEIIPDNATILDTLGWIEYKLKNLDEAFKHLFMANKLSPDSNGITLHLAEVQVALGQTQQARKLLGDMKNLTANDLSKRESLYNAIR
jgi:putative PEP-CTERM system TPR-repeat lipoprotein